MFRSVETGHDALIMDEYMVGRICIDTRITRIFAGSSEITLEIVRRSLGPDDRKL